MNTFERGDIYYVERFNGQIGSEQRSGRPALIVSNNKCNQYSDVLEVVYLTTQPKKDLPTHVTIRNAPRDSIALCEQVTSVSKDRVGDYISTANEREMQQIDTALLISLDLDIETTRATEETSDMCENAPVAEKPESDPRLMELEKELIRVTAQRDLYRELYSEINDRFYGKMSDG